MTLSQALLVTSRNPAVRVLVGNKKSYDYYGLLKLISGSKYDKINGRKYVIDLFSITYLAFDYKTCKEILKSNPDLRIKGLDVTTVYYNQSYTNLIFWEQDKSTKLNPENKNAWTLDKEASTQALELLFKEQGIL